jgi:DNA-binding protein HU-beta
MAKQSVLSQLASLSEETLAKIASSEFAKDAISGAQQAKDRVERLVKSVAELDDRLNALEKRVSALEPKKATPARKTTTAAAKKPSAAAKKKTTSTAAKSGAAKSSSAKKKPASGGSSQAS